MRKAPPVPRACARHRSPMATDAATVLLSGAGLYGGLLLLLALAQRRLIYHPDRTRPEPSRAGVPEMDALTLKSADGLELLAWHRPPREEGLPTICYFHGNAGHLGCRGGKLRPYLDAGFGVLLPAYRGFSGNPGKPTEDGLYQDAEAALDFLARAGVLPERLILYGESLGSAVAVEMASRRPAAALVLEAPITSVAEIGRHRFPLFPVNAIAVDRFDAKAKIGKLRLPVLLVHGGRDAIVPERFGRALFAAASEPKEARFIAEAAHNDLYDHGMAEIVLDFIARRLPAAAPPGPRPAPGPGLDTGRGGIS